MYCSVYESPVITKTLIKLGSSDRHIVRSGSISINGVAVYRQMLGWKIASRGPAVSCRHKNCYALCCGLLPDAAHNLIVGPKIRFACSVTKAQH